MIEARHLQKSFGSLQVTRNVSMTLAPGERRAVIGPNGAGKTTLFNLIAGDLAPSSGAVLLDGADITKLGPEARVRAGMARSFQRNNLFLDLTVAQNLAIAIALQQRKAAIFWKPFAGLKDVHAQAHALAAEVGLGPMAQAMVRHLSYGSQRQLEVGLALATKPRILLLDEPTAGMSPEETHDMQKLIAGLSRTITLLIIEHDMDVVFSLADRITVLHQGEIMAEGSCEEIQESPAVREIYLGEDF